MKTHAVFFALFPFVFAATLFAQEAATQPAPSQPAVPAQPPMPSLPPMNATQLLRMKNDLTFQLQESQRVLRLVGQDDKQLTDLHKQQQAEIVAQLKDIETQLKAQGVPTDSADSAGTPALPPGLPRAQDPTLVPGGLPQPAADPNLLVQQRQPGMMSQQPGMPQMPPGFQMMNPMMPPQPSVNPYPGNPADAYGPITPGMTTPNATVPGMPVPSAPGGFDQDQAWANSPWVPQPSKELTEMKQTVESLRKEIGDLKSTVKALETQIQLLNRNILLSQPQTVRPATDIP